MTERLASLGATAEPDTRVAVIGMACRFPGASSLEQLWSNLVGGVESLTEVTDEQLRGAGVSERRIADPHYVRLIPLMDDIEGFDARYFGYHLREAEIADPQQRVFLEVCSSALQHAGYDPARYPGRVGVFGGSAPNRYNYENVYENSRIRATVGDMAIEINNNQDYLSTRVAYALGLTGPAISIATACSTSLVAVHLACRALAGGECDMALAGGVNILLPYHKSQLWTENSIYSQDGHIRAFDADAGGTNFGAGAGAVLLKRYSDAVAEGDHVEAVILGSAVNNDGARRAGFSAPGADGQVAVIVQALLNAGSPPPDSIGYVEAHGTGTLVGDPIEVDALTEAYRRAGATGVQTCPIGSVKTNIGHLGAAAGIAGLIKTVLAIRHGRIPESLHLRRPNPRINFVESPFYVNRQLAGWAAPGPRRAGVSSFGIGGTNAHVIVEEGAGAQDGEHEARPWQILPLSACTPSALTRMCDELGGQLRSATAGAIADVAYTLQVGRRELKHRAAIVCRDTGDALAQLAAVPAKAVEARSAPPVVFLFPGQGAQHVDMAEELYRGEPVYRDALDECAELLRPQLAFDVRDAMFGARGAGRSREEMAERLRQTSVTQPVLFAVEYALARQWMSWGVEPAAMVGHSVGEYVAACLAGVFSLSDALELVAARGQLSQAAPAGSMLAVPMGEDAVQAFLTDDLSLAAVNGPQSCVLSGPTEAIDALRGLLAMTGVQAVVPKTSHAFHSAMLDEAVEPLRDLVGRIGPKPPERPFVSTVTGTWITAAEATDPRYWGRQLRDPVRFAAACRTAAEGGAILLEVGPGRTLAGHARATLGPAGRTVASLPRPDREGSDQRSMARAVAALWTNGAAVDWPRLHEPHRRRRVALPAYPYERQRCWVDPDPDPDPVPVPKGGAITGAGDEVLPAGESTFVPIWRREDVTAVPRSQPTTVPWLIFTPGFGPAEAVATEAAARGMEVVRIGLGDGYQELGGGRYTIRPAEPADYDALLAEIIGGYGPPRVVVHGWTAGERVAEDPTAPTDLRELGFYSLLNLSQALLRHLPTEPVDVRVLTSGCCNVTGSEPVDPYKALLTGPCRVVPTENPHLSCQLVDVAPSAGLSGGALARLMTELTEPATHEWVAYRSGRRWVADHQHLTLPPRADLPRLLRRRGVYLITGGLGGIGLEVAKELAATAGARLVLVNRTPLPAPEDWDRYLAEHGDGDPAAARMLGVRQLESLGAEVMTAAADVTDEAAMAAVVDAARRRFGRVDGVFHAAGVPGGGLAAMRGREQADSVMAPKVDGTLVLDRVLGDEIDLLVLFSSIVSVAGDYGMVDYCSANAFLDAFAQSRAGSRTYTVAVNWCGWTDLGMVEAARGLAPEGFRQLERDVRQITARHVLLDRLEDRGEDIVFSTRVDPGFHWVVADHQMAGLPVLPGTAYAELIRAGYAEAVGSGPVEIQDLIFFRPMAIGGEREIRLAGRRLADGRCEFTVTSRPLEPGAGWERHASATVRPYLGDRDAPRHDLMAIRSRCTELTWSPNLDDPALPVTFGPHWRVIEAVDLGVREHLVEARVPAGLDHDVDDFMLHPALLDAATALGLFLPDIVRGGRSFLPMAYDRLVVRDALPAHVFSHVRTRGTSGAAGEVLSFDVRITDETGRELVAIEGFRVRPIDNATVLAGVAAVPAPAAEVDADAVSPDVDVPDATPTTAVVDYLIRPREGVDLLWRMLNGGVESQYVISRETVAQRVRRMRRIAAAVESAEAGQLVSAPARPAGPVTEGAAAGSSTEQRLLALWMDAFGMSTLGVDDDFFDIGGNSLVAVQLAVRIREHFGVNIPGVAILEDPTVRTLAARVDQALAEQDAVQPGASLTAAPAGGNG